MRAYDRGHPLAPSLLLAATNQEVNMFAWLKNRLCGKKEPAIAAGETWEFVDLLSDPWGGKEPFRVQILDVRDGWVRYSMGDIFPDERRPVGRFVGMYRRVDTQSPAGA